MSFALILFPLLMAGLAVALPSNRWRPRLLPVVGTGHLAMTILILVFPSLNPNYDWLILDPLAKVVLLCISTLFFFCSWYAVGYLGYRQERSNRIFTSCFIGFLGLVSLVVQSHHLGLMWVAMEGTTLITAPLIYFNRTKLSIEATWKYLLVGSVGIALALLGTFFLAYAAIQGGLPASLSFDELLRSAPQLSKPWLRAAFILLLVGYGTKMGLAPMHSWKPDTYGESPGVVGAIFAGGVTSAAFLAFLRVYQICLAAGEAAFCNQILLIMGVISMAIAGMFMIGQRDIKRMLAYSSVEHMGILVLGLGIGKTALFGTMLHVVNNSLTKGVLFLSAGNIQRAFGSKNTDQVRGAIRRLPISGSLFLAGFLAITGSPPFAPFISEFAILKGAFDANLFLIAATFLLLLLIVFIGMGSTVLKVTQGRFPPALGDTNYTDSVLTAVPALALMSLVLLLGLYIPDPLRNLLTDAVRFLENQS
jgi:hydrogenase-4 component F